MNKCDILLAAHRVAHAALTEWIGMNKDDASADIQYLWGIHDLAEELINRLDDEDLTMRNSNVHRNE